jgi:hypothetical protein
VGKHDTIDFSDITASHPWYLDYNRSNIEWTNGVNPTAGGAITCVINRDWITTWSDFNLKGGMPLRTNFGFRVYASLSA